MRIYSTASFLLASLVLAIPASAKSSKGEISLRDRAQALCFDEVQKLCNDEIPDEDKVKSCMMKKHAQLSAPCREVFDEGMK